MVLIFCYLNSLLFKITFISNIFLFYIVKKLYNKYFSLKTLKYYKNKNNFINHFIKSFIFYDYILLFKKNYKIIYKNLNNLIYSI